MENKDKEIKKITVEFENGSKLELLENFILIAKNGEDENSIEFYEVVKNKDLRQFHIGLQIYIRSALTPEGFDELKVGIKNKKYNKPSFASMLKKKFWRSKNGKLV